MIFYEWGLIFVLFLYFNTLLKMKKICLFFRNMRKYKSQSIVGIFGLAVVGMFFREYLTLVLISNIIALPMANWMMNQ